MKSDRLPSGLFVGTLIVLAVLLLQPTTGPAGDSQSSGASSRTDALSVPASTAVPRIDVGVALDPATPPEEPSPDECAIWYGTTDRIALSVEHWALASTAVVRATVEDIGDTQWNTPNGKAPAERQAEASDFMRLIKLAPADIMKGQLTSTVARIPGGTIGCLTFILDEYDVKVGQEYLVFMRELDPATGLRGTLNARLMWPVEADGTVTTPVEGTLTVDEIGERIAGS